MLIEELIHLLSENSQKGLVGFKSELESEGVRADELALLNSIAAKSNLPNALKIGGSEAKSDLYLALLNLSDYVIVPMIETGYSAKKAMACFDQVSSVFKYTKTKLLINIETVTALKNIDDILDSVSEFCSGVVFGRVDFTLSAGLSRSDVNSSFVLDSALHVAKRCKDRGMEFVVGGGISVESLDFLKACAKYRLDRFETRKCIIDAKQIMNKNVNELLTDAVRIELVWLKIKRHLHMSLSTEDNTRISMLESRYLYNFSSCG